MCHAHAKHVTHTQTPLCQRLTTYRIASTVVTVLCCDGDGGGGGVIYEKAFKSKGVRRKSLVQSAVCASSLSWSAPMMQRVAVLADTALVCTSSS
ncbi:hypothetical protein O3P69_014263 [Scylla paramamosain]|uniref:Uncharacterized protein n=1 Tax=Scylla paramamosain TaxID=85552 RepID=A0AAW0TDK8_SCYPA